MNAERPSHADLAVALRRAREVRRLSQRELAARFRISVKTLGRWERGTISGPSVAIIEDFLNMNTAKSNGPPLSQATDAELLAEIALRLSRTNNPKEEL